MAHQDCVHLLGGLPQPAEQELAEAGVVTQALRLDGRGNVLAADGPQDGLPRRHAQDGFEAGGVDRVEHSAADDRVPQMRRQGVEHLGAEVGEERVVRAGDAVGLARPTQRVEDDAGRPAPRRLRDLGWRDDSVRRKHVLNLTCGERERLVGHDPRPAGDHSAAEVEMDEASGHQHHQGAGGEGLDHGAQDRQHRRPCLNQVQVVDHEGRACGELLGHEGGAVGWRDAGVEHPRDALRHLRVDTAHRSGEVGGEAPRTAVGLPEGEPGLRARAGGDELGRPRSSCRSRPRRPPAGRSGRARRSRASGSPAHAR